MKRMIYAMLAVVVFGAMLIGCGSVDSESNLIFVGKRGQVQTVDVETFDKAHYSQADFESYAKEAIDAYNNSHETDAVTLKEFTVEGDTAKLKMSYKSTADFSAFNETVLYQGTIAAAVSDGYLFDVPFSKVENGEVIGSATRTDILSEEGLSVVIIKANTNVQVDGKIHYVSTQNVTVTAKDMVSVSDEENTSFQSEVCTYIIYK